MVILASSLKRRVVCENGLVYVIPALLSRIIMEAFWIAVISHRLFAVASFRNNGNMKDPFVFDTYLKLLSCDFMFLTGDTLACFRRTSLIGKGSV